MTVVTQSLDLYKKLIARNPKRAAEKVDLAQEKAHAALGLMRDFASELRETETSDGLRIAMENLMRISVPSHVHSEVLFEGEEEHLPDYVRDQLYMVLREGVRNAVAHSGADSITVEVSIAPKEVTARVWDRGDGFETSDDLTEGIGLESMRERAELLGGAFSVSAQPGRGTTVEASMPLVRTRVGQRPEPPPETGKNLAPGSYP
jgi:signal transduction histidine kinase